LITVCGEKYTEEEARMLSPLVLAYIGDSVFDLFVRTSLIRSGKTGRLHALSSKKVCAKAQAEVAKTLLCDLSESEKDIFMRGRNAKTPTVPKHADICDYHMATGLEALVGYLYITGADSRLRQLMSAVTGKRVDDKK
jgi:ribonuclease-3 family protein